MSVEDLEFAMQVIDRQPGSAEEFTGRFRGPLMAHLFSRCESPEDRDEAVFIVDGLLARCCADRLLEKYLGSGSLEGWMKTIAANDLNKHWDRKRRNPIVQSIEGIETTGRTMVSDPSEIEEPDSVDPAAFHSKLMEATVHAFGRLRQEFPDSLAILRLSTLHGVSQRDLARAFATHESEISKKKTKGIEFLKSEINQFLTQSFPRGAFTWSDLREFARNSDEIVHDEDLADRLLNALGKR